MVRNEHTNIWDQSRHLQLIEPHHLEDCILQIVHSLHILLINVEYVNLV